MVYSVLITTVLEMCPHIVGAQQTFTNERIRRRPERDRMESGGQTGSRMGNSALCQEREMPPDLREEAMDGIRLSGVGVGVSRMLREEPWCWCGSASEWRRQFSGAPRESEETSRGCKWLSLRAQQGSRP